VPPVAAVSVGDTVTWTNYDKVPHTVTTTTDSYNATSPLMQNGDRFSFTFTYAGVFTYYCEVHPFMVGHIYVGVTPPPSAAIVNPSSSPVLALSVKGAGAAGVSLTATLSEVPMSEAAGVPVSFFARYKDNSSTFWLKLDTRSTGSNGTAQLTLPKAGATGFQAFAPRVGNLQAGYSNVVDFGVPTPAVAPATPSSMSYMTILAVPAVAGLFFSWFLLLRRWYS